MYDRWYQIKISMRWEDSRIERVGIPARVVQYEGTSYGVLLFFKLIIVSIKREGAH